MISALRAAIEKIPTREERLGGQTFKYVKLSEILDLLDTFRSSNADETSAPIPHNGPHNYVHKKFHSQIVEQKDAEIKRLRDVLWHIRPLLPSVGVQSVDDALKSSSGSMAV